MISARMPLFAVAICCLAGCSQISAPTVHQAVTPGLATTRTNFSAAQNACWNLGYSKPTVSQIEVMECIEKDLQRQRSRLDNLVSEIGQ